MVGNDLHRHGGHDAGVQAHAHGMFTQGTDGGVHEDAAAVHIHAQSGQGIADDAAGHGAVQLVVVAHMHGDDDFQGFQPGAQGLGVSAQGVHAFLELLAFQFKGLHVGFGSHHGQALGQQEVAAVAGLHGDDVAKVAEIFHVGAEYQFHVRLLRSCSFS